MSGFIRNCTLYSVSVIKNVEQKGSIIKCNKLLRTFDTRQALGQVPVVSHEVTLRLV